MVRLDRAKLREASACSGHCGYPNAVSVNNGQDQAQTPPRSRGDSPGWPPPCWGGCSCTVWDARGLRPGAALAGQARLPARTRSVCGEEFGGKHRHGMARKQPSVLNPAHKHRQLPSKLHLNPPGSFVWHFYCGAVSRNVNLLLMTFFFFF